MIVNGKSDLAPSLGQEAVGTPAEHVPYGKQSIERSRFGCKQHGGASQLRRRVLPEETSIHGETVLFSRGRPNQCGTSELILFLILPLQRPWFNQFGIPRLSKSSVLLHSTGTDAIFSRRQRSCLDKRRNHHLAEDLDDTYEKPDESALHLYKHQ